MAMSECSMPRENRNEGFLYANGLTFAFGADLGNCSWGFILDALGREGEKRSGRP